MNKHMFLQGEIGVGKSTIIKNSISSHMHDIGGFYSQRIYIGEKYVGFALKCVQEEEEYKINRYVNSLNEVDNIFLYSDDNGRWKINNDVFLNYGISLLKKGYTSKKLILMDELGGVELKCIPFMREIFNLLDGNIPVLGVLKTESSITKLQNKLSNSLNKDSPSEFYERILNHSNVKIVNISRENYIEANNNVTKFVEDLFR